MPTYRTQRRTSGISRTIETPIEPLGRGGEAEVYAVKNERDLVAKIYTKGIMSNGRLTKLGSRKERKLLAMIAGASPTKDASGELALAVCPRNRLREGMGV